MAKSKKASVMSDLMDEVEAPSTKAPGKAKKDRPVIQCNSEEEITALDTFASADAILKVAEAAQGSAKGHAYEVFKHRFLLLCAQKGYLPANPLVQSPNSRGNYIVKHVNKFNRTGPSGEVISASEQLKEMGFDEKVIEKVENDIIKEKVVFGLKRFTDLTSDEAPPEHHELAEKLMTLVKKHFTADQRKILLEKSITTEVDPGWKETAVKLACDSVSKEEDDYENKVVENLNKLWTVIPPSFMMSQMVFSGELSSAFKQIMPTPTAEEAAKEEAKTTEPKPAPKISVPKPVPKVIPSANGKYKASILGNVVTLFIVKPDGEKEVGAKQCENPGHAEATARKWFKTPDYLNEFILECADAKK